VARQQANLEANLAEMLSGRARLESTPPSLGIDMFGACNVKPPCVYCEWDYNKDLEGENVGAPFTRETLGEWGEFFDNSVSLVNCSIGEPFMMKNIDDLLDIFGEQGKVLEMTTNGQILTDRNIQKLIGRTVDLYISLDAGTAETYARIRNNTFDRILSNLRRLIEAKGGPGHLPRVHLVFMPMRINVHELDRFIEICADLRVDRMVLRPLNYSESIGLDWDREGYRFQYQHELLPFDELVRVSGRAAELCRQRGVNLADQMDFGSSMRQLFAAEFERGRQEAILSLASAADPAPAAETPGAVLAAATEPPTVEAPAAEPPGPQPALPSLGTENRPICTEPWKSQYILRRGVLPCCYGGKPIAPMDGYREAWNSPLVQEIRTELLQGRFHAYCLASPACPIVRKEQQAATLPAAQTVRLQARGLANTLDRWTGGLLRPIRRPAGWVADKAERAIARMSRLAGRTRTHAD
jgi:molybdenum cofactor biosynthesis enzyme MoaA